MKKLLLAIFSTISLISISQPSNYYSTCIGLSGDNLKQELHNIIDDHTSFSYTTTKSILRASDEDPNNQSNIMLVYSGNSIDKFDFATNSEPDFWNREHVWPKSHGDFDDGQPFEVPAYTDAHNLKPIDSSINTLRGEKDFDNGGQTVMNGNVQTDCLSTSSTFEPRDEVKGDIARIILYMDVRYNGDIDNEPQLAIANGLTDTYDAEIGVLSTLLEWHQMDPPDAFEKRRNDIIYEWQGNRNPFIDYPEFVDYIWSENPQINPIDITNVTINPEAIEGGQEFTISCSVLSAINCPVESVTLNYGNSWGEMSNSSEMTINNGQYEVQIPDQDYNTMFCYSITATICEDPSQTFFGSEVIPPEPFEGILTPISEIQGQVEYSPYDGQTVSTTGIVTGAFANSFYIQDGAEPWSGIYIYSGGALPSMGDSVIVSGEISEFCYDGSPCDCSACGGAGVTEFYQPENIYIISNNNPLPEPILVSSGTALSEEYEGVLVRIENATCESLPGQYGVWNVDDGSGICGIHNTPDGYEFDPQVGEAYNITGIVTSTFNEWKIDLRIPSDVEGGPDTTAPYILTYLCEQTPTNYYVSLSFNEPFNTSLINTSNFLTTSASIENISTDWLDPTKVILTLNNITSNNIGLMILEMEDLNGNTAANINYNINCDFEISTLEHQKSKIDIFPNPSKGLFTLNLVNDENFIKIFKSNGKLIKQNTLESGSHIFNIDIPGFYYIEINQDQRLPLIIN